MADYRATYTSHTQAPTTSHPLVGEASELRGLSFLSLSVVATTQPPWCGSSTVFEQDAWTLVCRTVGVLITNICPTTQFISQRITSTWYQNHLGSFGDTYVNKSPPCHTTRRIGKGTGLGQGVQLLFSPFFSARCLPPS